jgi:hypothetical protein
MIVAVIFALLMFDELIIPILSFRGRDGKMELVVQRINWRDT